MQLFGDVFSLPVPEARLLIITDEANPKAQKIYRRIRHLSSAQPDFICVIGGDGFLLRAIRKYWSRGLPFIGINAGHIGFLLNEEKMLKKGFPKKLFLYTLPLLEGEMLTVSGERKRFIAFNDAWVERGKNQTAWTEVKVDGLKRIRRLISDGALVSTPAGSTAYARAMGASPLPLNAQTLVLVGNNVASPNFKWCYLPINSTIEFTTLDPNKRPLVGVVDGVRYGKVQHVTISVSRTKTVQLAFSGRRSLAEKLAKLQFGR